MAKQRKRKRNGGMMSYPIGDVEFREGTVARVEGSSFTDEDGWSLLVEPPPAAQPRVGGTYRIYGHGVGYHVRGAFFDGERNYYRSKREHAAYMVACAEEKQRRWRSAWENGGRADYEAKLAGLPAVFRRRIERFASNKPNFAIQYGEYEMSCCIDAVKIAATCETPDAVREFWGKSYGEQKATVPDLYDGHSGNTFAMAVRLAHHYLTDPDLVWREHAAIAALVGCDEAGCHPILEGG